MKKILYALVVFFLLFCFSCEKDAEEKNTNTLENINPPTNNDDILGEPKFGIEHSSIWNSLKINNELYVVGFKTYKHYIAKLDLGGNEIWSKPLDIEPASLIEVDGKILVFGDLNDKIKVQLYDNVGNLLDEVIYSDDYLSFNAISITPSIEENEIIVEGESLYFKLWGYSKINAKYSHFVVELELTEENKFIKQGGINKIELNNNALYLIHGVKYVGGNNYIIYANKYYNNSNKQENVFVMKLNMQLDIITECTYDIIWKKNMSFNYSETGIKDKSLIVKDNKIWGIGNFPDTEKELTGSGNHWISPFAFCMDMNGNILWEQKISITNRGDYANQIFYAQGNIFIVGKGSGIRYENNGNIDNIDNFGYGMLIKINKDGNVEYKKTFGDQENYQVFNSVKMFNNNICLLGFANRRKSNKKMKSWFVKVMP